MLGFDISGKVPFFMQTPPVPGESAEDSTAVRPSLMGRTADEDIENLTQHEPKSQERGALAACAIVEDSCEELELYRDSLDVDTDPEPLKRMLAMKIKEAVADRKVSPPKIVRPSGKLPGWGTLFEICVEPESNLGLAAGE